MLTTPLQVRTVTGEKTLKRWNKDTTQTQCEQRTEVLNKAKCPRIAMVKGDLMPHLADLVLKSLLGS